MSGAARAALRACALAAWIGSAGLALAQPAPVQHELSLSIDPQTRMLLGHATTRVTLGRAFEVRLARRLSVDALRIDGLDVLSDHVEEGEFRVWRAAPRAGARRIEARWHGEWPGLGPEGSYLPEASGWHPHIPGALATWNVALELPAGQVGLVPGRLVEEARTASHYRARFEFPHPVESLALMAGPYRVQERLVQTAQGKPVRLRCYFHPAIADLAAGYLDSIKGYLDLYEGWIGEYPFGEFSVVSSPTPTGLGMPTLTYIGVEVLKLPFIRATSLGHEVLHNWWGNGVYPDYARGNWSEGLTTFMADYAYRERESAAAGREMRLAWLRDIAAVPPGKDAPLRAFVARSHGTSQIVGYHKAAQVFVMLREWIGREAFDAGLRAFWREHRFRVAGWRELQRAFEAASGHSLERFFAQWLERPGVPALWLADARADAGRDGWRVSVTLAQDSEPWALRVPVVVRTAAGEAARVLEMRRASETFVIETPARPRELALDPEWVVLRRLSPEEAPPILRQAMIDPALVTVLPGGTEQGAAKRLAEALSDHPLRFTAPQAPPGNGPLLVIGLHGPVESWLASHGLPRRPATLAGKGTAQVWTAARQGAGPLTVVSARDAASLALLARPLPHYGRQSFVVFDGARMVERGVWPAQPQVWRFP